MSAAGKKPDPGRQAQLRAELRRDVAKRRAGYREQALKLFPHVCASCGREFSGRRLKELTVHHKDHDHTNNPPDGSNWELLCIYCHDHEHEKDQARGNASDADITRNQAASKIANPFDNLDQLLGGDE